MKRIYIALIFTIAFLSLQAQSGNSNYQREVTVEKEYTPTLLDADKLNEVPEVKSPEVPKTVAEYSNYTLDTPVVPNYQAIKAPAYFSDFATSKKRGYLDLGLGTFFNLDGDAGYQILRSEQTQWNVFASHRSSNGKVTYLQKSKYLPNYKSTTMKFNDNLLGSDFTTQLEKLKLSADMQYVYSGFNDYGFLVSSNKSMQDQENQRFKVHAGMESLKNDKLTFKANLAYTLFTHKRPIEWPTGKENRVMADVDVFTKWFGVALASKTYQYQMPNTSLVPSLYYGYVDYNTLSLKPYVQWDGAMWDAKLGVILDWQTGGIKDFLLAPNVRFNWRPADNFLLSITATGGIQDNSNYNTHLENRYINPNYRVNDSKTLYDATLGLSFSPITNLNVSLFGGYAGMQDEHFYTLLPMLPEYDDATLLKLGGKVQYDYQGFWDFKVDLQYNRWEVTDLPAAWHKPALLGNVNFGINIPNLPLRCDLNYHLEAGRKAWSVLSSKKHTIEDIHDLSLRANYTLNSTVSFFAKANNLLFQKYDIYYGYPAQNFNIIVGAGIKF